MISLEGRFLIRQGLRIPTYKLHRNFIFGEFYDRSDHKKWKNN